MSFAITTRQAREKTKDVTRRLRWLTLKPGDRVQQVVKGMGLKKGEHPEKIHVVEVVSVRRERLDEMMREPYGHQECVREGFPEMRGTDFVKMFCDHNGCDPSIIVTRIEFKYIP